VTFCSADFSSQCGGYVGGGYSHFVNTSGFLDGMNLLIRPFSNINNFTPLVSPLPNPHQWTQQKHFSWSNANSSDTNPVCGSTWTDNADGAITTPWEGEIFCLETDGAASTIWRFAHNRASGYTKFFNTQPLGSVSQDGRFFLFTSDWDEQVGISSNNVPRSDAWIVKLD